MESSSESEATSKRRRVFPSSESPPGKSIRESSSSVDPSLSSPSMADSPDVSTESDTVPEIVPESAQPQQQDNETVPEAVLEHVQQQDSEAGHDSEPENDQEQDIGYNADESDNEDDDADEDTKEKELEPLDPESRPMVCVVSRMPYREFNQDVLACRVVGVIYADKCKTWHQLSQRIRMLYYQVADQDAARHEVKDDINIAPTQSWPGRTLRFYSRVDNQLIERFWPEDAWVDLDLANNLYVIALYVPSGRACRIVRELSSGTETELDQVDIQNMESWGEFAASVKEVFYRVMLHKVAPNLHDVSPINSCPGAHVTFWGDLKEEWFYGASSRNGHKQDNWPAARLGICKVVISELKNNQI